MHLKSDDEIRALILKRFARIFAHGKPQTVYGDIGEKRGRSKGWWHPLAIAFVRRRERQGALRNQACRDFCDWMEDRRKRSRGRHVTIAVGTVLDVVVRYRRSLIAEAEQGFAEAILDNDIDTAVYWYKHLTRTQRVRWGLD